MLRACALCLPLLCSAQTAPLDLRLPTDNRALFTGSGPDFFQFVERNFEGQQTTPWEGGQFGFVRDPRRFPAGIAFVRFHEGMDIKPLKRDPRGDPLDEVRAILPGDVVYVTASATLSNYGRYVVVKHELGEGPFFSLYAHLREAWVTPGQKLAAGAPLGRMGYTGSGINQQRAHLHVELNMVLSGRFEAWHSAHFTTPNHHGVYNGLNLLGLDLQRLYVAHQKNPSLSLAAFIQADEAYYEISFPGNAGLEIAARYPWLRKDKSIPAVIPASWMVRCNRWGLPLEVKAGTQPVSGPVVSWVKDDPIPHYHNTRGILTGSGRTAKLTPEGVRFVQLLGGMLP
jgi:murein DD-endopeptidase MepM/ murein hydrolase activator NlpD